MHHRLTILYSFRDLLLWILYCFIMFLVFDTHSRYTLLDGKLNSRINSWDDVLANHVRHLLTAYRLTFGTLAEFGVRWQLVGLSPVAQRTIALINAIGKTWVVDKYALRRDLCPLTDGVKTNALTAKPGDTKQTSPVFEKKHGHIFGNPYFPGWLHLKTKDSNIPGRGFHTDNEAFFYWGWGTMAAQSV